MMETMTAQPNLHAWWEASRPHTWPNAFAPVIAGTGVAAFTAQAHLGRALLALLVAWALIIGVNSANDYSDGIRGTDDDRSGTSGCSFSPPESITLSTRPSTVRWPSTSWPASEVRNHPCSAKSGCSGWLR